MNENAGLAERLEAPAYWMSGSSDGHEGENRAPYEAAQRIRELEAALAAETERCAQFAERFPADPRSPRAIADGLRRAAAIRAGAPR